MPRRSFDQWDNKMALRICAIPTAGLALGQGAAAPGLAVHFSQSNSAKDVASAANVALFVPVGQAATPFLKPGKFTAEWRGFLGVDLRGDYAFQAELNGALKLEINGTVVLEASAASGATELSKTVRLGKGATNVLVATFTSPEQGDAYVRLHWKPRDSFPQPIPGKALSHAASDEEMKAVRLRQGRDLLVEHRCLHCHGGKPPSGMPELAMDAPTFEGIGSRRGANWMARWILNPKAMRPDGTMPQLLHGPQAADDARAIAEYLGSLKSTETPSTQTADASLADAGKKLFETLHCGACHTTPGSQENEAAKISLKQVGAKFLPGALEAFLEKPDAHYAWIRMPRFQLTDDQRRQLASYFLAHSEKPATFASGGDSAVERGKKLVQSTGCLNCHSLKLENTFSAKPLAAGAPSATGCLAEKPGAEPQAPQFHFTNDQREVLRAFLATDRASLARHDAAEFAHRQMKHLNCASCHGQFDGFPGLELLGEKLKPEWTEQFLSGAVKQKPRPWLTAQMPAFPKYAAELAKGLAMQHGLPPQTPPEPAVDLDASKIDNNLVSNPPLGCACV